VKLRTLIALAAILLGVALVVAFCASSGSDSQAQQQSQVQPVADDEQDDVDDDTGIVMFGQADDEDKPDCDAEDRRKNEVPDCGFYHGGKFVPWSWVAKGKKTPPAGWRAAPERQAVVKTTAPTRVATTAPATRPAAAPATTRPAPPVVTPAAPRTTAAKPGAPARRTGTTRTTTRRR
jgi:ABC-type antimicrobial peptide transport system permease subunit